MTSIGFPRRAGRALAEEFLLVLPSCRRADGLGYRGCWLLEISRPGKRRRALPFGASRRARGRSGACRAAFACDSSVSPLLWAIGFGEFYLQAPDVSVPAPTRLGGLRQGTAVPHSGLLLCRPPLRYFFLFPTYLRISSACHFLSPTRRRCSCAFVSGAVVTANLQIGGPLGIRRSLRAPRPLRRSASALLFSECFHFFFP